MKYRISLFFIFISMLACGFPASNPPAVDPVPETAPAPTETPPGVRQLSVTQLQNAEYQFGAWDNHDVVQLTDGQYQRGTDATTLDFAYAGLTQFTSAGDLDDDGVDELVAVFIENFGGTGNFAMLSVYVNVNGEPKFLTSTMIDDRPMINVVRVENGGIFVDAVIHGFNDGGCCPQLQSTQRFILTRNTLRLMHFTTLAPNGLERNISIESPADDAEANSSLRLSGNVSIAPFENNLSWFIFDEAGTQLAAGPVPVLSPDFGAPGTFDTTIPLVGIPAGTTVYLEVHDQNAADGSLFAMDAVKLFVK